MGKKTKQELEREQAQVLLQEQALQVALASEELREENLEPLQFQDKQIMPGKRVSVFAIDPRYLTVIGVDTNDGPEHPLWEPRWAPFVFDREEGMRMLEPLVQNILLCGVLSVVRAVRDGNRILIVDGRNRVIAAREANRRSLASGGPPVLVTVKAALGDEAQVMASSISANAFHRVDPPIVSAQKAARYLALDPTSGTKGLAKIFNVTEQTVVSWLKLLEAPKEAREAVVMGEVSAAQVLKSMGEGEIASRYESKPPSGEPTEEKPRKPKPATKGRPMGPTRSTIESVIEEGGGTAETLNVLRWVLGEITAEEAGIRINRPPRAAIPTKSMKDLARVICAVLDKSWSWQTCVDLAKQTEQPRKRVTKVLALLVEEGKIEAQGATRARVYRVVQE